MGQSKFEAHALRARRLLVTSLFDQRAQPHRPFLVADSAEDPATSNPERSCFDHGLKPTLALAASHPPDNADVQKDRAGSHDPDQSQVDGKASRTLHRNELLVPRYRL